MRNNITNVIFNINMKAIFVAAMSKISVEKIFVNLYLRHSKKHDLKKFIR